MIDHFYYTEIESAFFQATLDHF